MVTQGKSYRNMIFIIVFLITGFLKTFSQTIDVGKDLGAWDWGHLRIVRSDDNIEFLNRLHATVNQNGGPSISVRPNKKCLPQEAFFVGFCACWIEVYPVIIR